MTEREQSKDMTPMKQRVRTKTKRATAAVAAAVCWLGLVAPASHADPPHWQSSSLVIDF